MLFWAVIAVIYTLPCLLFNMESKWAHVAALVMTLVLAPAEAWHSIRTMHADIAQYNVNAMEAKQRALERKRDDDEAHYRILVERMHAEREAALAVLRMERSTHCEVHQSNGRTVWCRIQDKVVYYRYWGGPRTHYEGSPHSQRPGETCDCKD